MEQATNIEQMTDKTMSIEMKTKVRIAIQKAISGLGSQRKVAIKCGVNDAVISGLRDGTYPAKGDDMWFKVAEKLGVYADSWNLADTHNTRMVKQVLTDAKERSLFLGISYKAGSGKTASIQAFQKEHNANVYYILCRNWNARLFLIELCRIIGVNPDPGYPVDYLVAKVLHFFAGKVGKRPLLIIDQANSLKPGVLSFLIHLYNHCEDSVGVVMAGTEELRKKIKRGVANGTSGCDEIDSRFGRNYVELLGCTLNDVRKICAANGVKVKETQNSIFQACNPITKRIPGADADDKQQVQVIEDLRRLKREIINQQIINDKEAA